MDRQNSLYVLPDPRLAFERAPQGLWHAGTGRVNPRPAYKAASVSANSRVRWDVLSYASWCMLPSLVFADGRSGPCDNWEWQGASPLSPAAPANSKLAFRTP
eukprot:7502020-Pyramimonas_sp.AAC.1